MLTSSKMQKLLDVFREKEGRKRISTYEIVVHNNFSHQCKEFDKCC